MDLSTIHNKLEKEEYISAKEFEANIRLMFDNCCKFNALGTVVYNMGKQPENVTLSLVTISICYYYANSILC